jgi:hypothetical protein
MRSGAGLECRPLRIVSAAPEGAVPARVCEGKRPCRAGACPSLGRRKPSASGAAKDADAGACAHRVSTHRPARSQQDSVLSATAAITAQDREGEQRDARPRHGLARRHLRLLGDGVAAGGPLSASGGRWQARRRVCSAT